MLKSRANRTFSLLEQTIKEIITEETEDKITSKVQYSAGTNVPILDSMILLLMQCRMLAIGLELLIIT